MSPIKYSNRQPKLQYLGNKQWKLLEAVTMTWWDGSAELSVTASEGFVSDLASVPWWARWAIPVIDDHILPSIMHDWCYREKSARWVRKIQSDKLFLKGMKIFAVASWRRHVMWIGVKYGGQSSYQSS